MTKKCPRCKKNKELTEFHKNKAKKDGLQHVCKKCRKIYIRKHYLQNKKAYVNRRKKQQGRIKKLIWEIKKNSKCKCGEGHPAVLDFHHRNEKDKKYNISQSWLLTGRLKILKEIKKCDILCANCHRKLHYDENKKGFHYE